MDDFFAPPGNQPAGQPAGQPANQPPEQQPLSPSPTGGFTNDNQIDYLADAVPSKKRTAKPAATPMKSPASKKPSGRRKFTSDKRSLVKTCCISTTALAVIVAIFSFVAFLHVLGAASFIPAFVPNTCD
ncbi:hypothetical protein RB195_001582 [Necator americanus]